MAHEKRHFLVFLGVPGAGKGTQARRLEQLTGLPQVSTGDIFRYNLQNNTELGLVAKSYMDAGELVPDEVTIRMVVDRIGQDDCRRGAVLDGFPRNLEQAEALHEIAKPDGGVRVAPVIYISDEEAQQRITGRRVCRTCGAVYHITANPPAQAGVCDRDGGQLYQRDDDRPETVQNRLYVYYKHTSPLIGYYFAHGILEKVDGAQSIDQVAADLEAVMCRRGVIPS